MGCCEPVRHWRPASTKTEAVQKTASVSLLGKYQSLVTEYPLPVQCKNPVAERAKRRGLEILFIDLHAAVDHIDVGKQLRLRAHRTDGCAELRLAVVGEDHVLQQHRLLLGDAQLGGDRRDLLRTHNEMPEELALDGVVRDEPKLRECELLPLLEVMEQRTGEQETPVPLECRTPQIAVRWSNH